MKINEFRLGIMNIIKKHRMAFQNHSNHENLEFHVRIMKFMKIKKFKTRIMKIMKILELNVRIKKLMKILEPQ